MAEQRGSRLNQLLQQLPPGMLVGSDWLRRHGFSRASVHDYVKQGWLERLMPRVYRRPTALASAGLEAANTHAAQEPAGLRWEQAVVSAQAQLDEPFHVGGPTALDLLGLSHFLALGRQTRVWLYDPDRTAPGWLVKLPLDIELTLVTRRLFAIGELGLEWRRIDLGSGRLGAAVDMPVRRELWDQFLRIASPERAIVELLEDVGGDVGFRSADRLFEGLANLRPALLNWLLQQCTSIKAKRLFLFFADRHGHAWAKRLERERIDLGRGKRQIAKGGRLDPTYKITVPSDMIDGDAHDDD